MEAIKAPSMSCWMARAKIVVKSSRCVLLPRHADADDGGVKTAAQFATSPEHLLQSTTTSTCQAGFT